VEPWMDTAATDGSAKRSRVDRLKQRRLRRDSDALTPEARIRSNAFLVDIYDALDWTLSSRIFQLGSLTLAI